MKFNVSQEIKLDGADVELSQKCPFHVVVRYLQTVTMSTVVGRHLMCRLYSGELSRQTLSCRSHSDVLKIIQRLKYTRPASMKQTPRSKAAFKLTGLMEGGYILLLFPAACFGLGSWQVSRRRWKLDLLDKIEARTKAPPQPLPENLNELNPVEQEYSRYILRGKFEYTKEAVIAPRSNLNEDASHMKQTRLPGVHIITPFKLADRDEKILINRGWLSSDQFKDLVYRRNGQVEEEVELVGLLRHDDKRNTWVSHLGFEVTKPGNEETFLQRDIPAIAEALGTAPVFFDATELRLKPGAPLGGQTRISLPNNHGSYIITWYGLAICTVWLWFDRYRRSVPPKNISQMIEMQKRFK